MHVHKNEKEVMGTYHCKTEGETARNQEAWY